MLPLSPRLSAVAAAAAATAALALPAASPAAVSTVFSGNSANPQAVAAGGGGVLLGDFIDDAVRLGVRDGDHIGAAQEIYRPVEFERLWASAADGASNTTILTLRKHKPYQRVRVVVRSKDGVASAPRTISGRGHSATQPSLAVAPDGSAVAAWAWHDKPGWRVQAAVRAAGSATFGPAVTLSEPDTSRPFITVAVGRGGAAAVTWQFGGSYLRHDEPLHIASASTGGAFGAAQTLTDAGDHAQVGLGVDDAGHVVLAYSPEYYMGANEQQPSRLLLAEGPAGGALGAVSQLGSGGPGVISGPGPSVAFTGGGDTIVGWVARTGANEEGGRAELFVRPRGSDAFGAAQVLAGPEVNPVGLVVAGGPDGRAVATWYQSPKGAPYPSQSIHAAVRGAGGGVFGAESRVSPDGEVGLWPTAAITASGDAIVTWVHNSDGSGGGQAEAAVLPAG